jgi:hypothetical protein
MEPLTTYALPEWFLYLGIEYTIDVMVYMGTYNSVYARSYGDFYVEITGASPNGTVTFVEYKLDTYAASTLDRNIQYQFETGGPGSADATINGQFVHSLTCATGTVQWYSSMWNNEEIYKQVYDTAQHTRVGKDYMCMGTTTTCNGLGLYDFMRYRFSFKMDAFQQDSSVALNNILGSTPSPGSVAPEGHRPRFDIGAEDDPFFRFCSSTLANSHKCEKVRANFQLGTWYDIDWTVTQTDFIVLINNNLELYIGDSGHGAHDGWGYGPSGNDGYDLNICLDVGGANDFATVTNLWVQYSAIHPQSADNGVFNAGEIEIDDSSSSAMAPLFMVPVFDEKETHGGESYYRYRDYVGDSSKYVSPYAVFVISGALCVGSLLLVVNALLFTVSHCRRVCNAPDRHAKREYSPVASTDTDSGMESSMVLVP